MATWGTPTRRVGRRAGLVVNFVLLAAAVVAVMVGGAPSDPGPSGMSGPSDDSRLLSVPLGLLGAACAGIALILLKEWPGPILPNSWRRPAVVVLVTVAGYVSTIAAYMVLATSH